MPTHKLRPSAMAGLCPVCAGTAMMPRSAPEAVRVPCDGCGATGVMR